MASASRPVVIVVAPRAFRDEELIVPRRALEAAGHAVTIASTRTGRAAGMRGHGVVATVSIRALDAAAFDAVVIVGGDGSPQHLWECEPLLLFARRMHASGKVVAAICLSAAVLARAGLLSGLRATVYPSPRAVLELKRGGAHYVDDAIVEDGGVLTASGPEAAPAFGARLVQLLGT